MIKRFDDLVDEAAGSALQELIRGEQWRSIIVGVCIKTAYWKAQELYEQHKKEVRKKKRKQK